MKRCTNEMYFEFSLSWYEKESVEEASRYNQILKVKKMEATEATKSIEAALRSFSAE